MRHGPKLRKARAPSPHGPFQAVVEGEKPKPAELSTADLKALIAGIPTQRDPLYALEVDWEAVASTKLVEEKLKPFTAKKMAEYLGEDEPTLVTFVVGKLNERVGAEVIEAELEKILDDDAAVFTVKLWRMLHFEVLRAKAAAP